MRLTGLRNALLTLSFAAAACSDSSGPQQPETLDRLPRQLSVAEQKLVTGSNSFAFDLMREINRSQRGSNVFVSPLSASMALGMTANGAAGTTWEAMRDALRLGGASREEVISGYKSLIELLGALDGSTDFRIANSIWYEKRFPFHQSFLSESESFFGAEVRGLDFRDTRTLGTINSWVSGATEKKIPTIIDELRGDEVMFLINAMYFKGSWRSRFERGRTANAPFFAYDGSSAPVPLMMQSAPIRMAFEPGFVAADLLYGNSAFAMTIVLPNVGSDVNTVVETLNMDRWKSLEQGFRERESVLFLPRFKLEWKRKLNEDLKALGMGIAFTEDQADFTRMSPQGRSLVISDVIQKTFVDVNEDGTEAAAATSVGIVPVSAPPTIRVDRPFMFVIRERLSGTIMFIGKIAKLPASS